MATLTLTKEEEDADSCLSFDNESLGRMVKYVATILGNQDEDKDGKNTLTIATCAVMLIARAHKANASTMKLDLKGVTSLGKEFGDWKLILKKQG